MKLSKLLTLYKASEVDALCKELTGFSLNERGLKYEDIEANWKFVGNNPSNGSVINMLKKGEKGLIERITNGIDAVIERKVAELRMGVPASASAVIKQAFPKYYANCQAVKRGEADSSRSYDATGQVMVAVSDGSRASRPTYDVVDQGTGIPGNRFADTILSINKGNKLSNDKRYLIGAFGQGGSTSLSFAHATIIISKFEGKYFFTIVKQVDLEDYKNVAYVYMTIAGEIPECEYDGTELFEENWIQSFIDGQSGTFIRMVDMSISQEISQLDAAKPRGLADFINTELFDAGLPVAVYENRKNFGGNEHKQNRTAYGSALKLGTWSYLKQEYSGSLTIDYNNNPYQINYYAILPNDQDDWASDAKCRGVFEQINVYDDPIVYTVNGQMVCTEPFTRLKHNGLNQLKFRLLIVINLDLLGKEKYKFFTTDRSQIKVTDSSKGLLQAVIDKICHEEKLVELNSIIAGLALSKGLDDEEVAKIADQVKSEYSQYLKNGGMVKFKHPVNPPKPRPEKDYEDHIVELTASCSKSKFYRDEEITIIVKTGAEKYVNEQENVDLFMDGRTSMKFVETDYRGAIYFKATARSLGFGTHSVMLGYYGKGGEILESEAVIFEVINEDSPEKQETKHSKVPNINIVQNTNQELVIDFARNEAEGSITISYNNVHEKLYDQVYGKEARESDLKEVTDKYLKPTVLFVLFMGEAYENLEDDEQRNQLVVNFIKAQLTSFGE